MLFLKYLRWRYTSSFIEHIIIKVNTYWSSNSTYYKLYLIFVAYNLLVVITKLKLRVFRLLYRFKVLFSIYKFTITITKISDISAIEYFNFTAYSLVIKIFIMLWNFMFKLTPPGISYKRCIIKSFIMVWRLVKVAII